MANDQPRGHGSHWAALGFGDANALMAFLQTALQRSGSVRSFGAPWPGEPWVDLDQFEYLQAPLRFATLVGRKHPQEPREVLAAFPVLTQRAEWVVRVDGPRKTYGPVEGVGG